MQQQRDNCALATGPPFSDRSGRRNPLRQAGVHAAAGVTSTTMQRSGHQGTAWGFYVEAASAHLLSSHQVPNARRDQHREVGGNCPGSVARFDHHHSGHAVRRIAHAGANASPVRSRRDSRFLRAIRPSVPRRSHLPRHCAPAHPMSETRRQWSGFRLSARLRRRFDEERDSRDPGRDWCAFGRHDGVVRFRWRVRHRSGHRVGGCRPRR